MLSPKRTTSYLSSHIVQPVLSVESPFDWTHGKLAYFWSSMCAFMYALLTVRSSVCTPLHPFRQALYPLFPPFFPPIVRKRGVGASFSLYSCRVHPHTRTHTHRLKGTLIARILTRSAFKIQIKKEVFQA